MKYSPPAAAADLKRWGTETQPCGPGGAPVVAADSVRHPGMGHSPRAAAAELDRQCRSSGPANNGPTKSY